jgi:uncharacterized protein YuzB (UPF0349 family)
VQIYPNEPDEICMSGVAGGAQTCRQWLEFDPDSQMSYWKCALGDPCGFLSDAEEIPLAEGGTVFAYEYDAGRYLSSPCTGQELAFYGRERDGLIHRAFADGSSTTLGR